MYDTFKDVDWSHFEEHAATRSVRHAGDLDIPVGWAIEALNDSEALVFDPDYNSISGKGIRVIGYSLAAEALVTVILFCVGATVFAANAWLSNKRDRSRYQKEG